MIKYGIFIQGGESMKKIISLVLATLVCAAVFVGCGSDKNSENSEASQSIPSHVGISLNSDLNSIKKSIDLEKFDDGYDDGDRQAYINKKVCREKYEKNLKHCFHFSILLGQYSKESPACLWCRQSESRNTLFGIRSFDGCRFGKNFI